MTQLGTRLDLAANVCLQRLQSFRVMKNLFVVIVVTGPLPRDGGMAEGHGGPEAGQLSKA